MKYAAEDVLITCAIVDEQLVAILTPIKSQYFSQAEVLEIPQIPVDCKSLDSLPRKQMTIMNPVPGIRIVSDGSPNGTKVFDKNGKDVTADLVIRSATIVLNPHSVPIAILECIAGSVDIAGIESDKQIDYPDEIANAVVKAIRRKINL